MGSYAISTEANEAYIFNFFEVTRMDDGTDGKLAYLY
jgi:hypothetical protein